MSVAVALLFFYIAFDACVRHIGTLLDYWFYPAHDRYLYRLACIWVDVGRQ